jgi:outer membrane protein assembly factor BamD (BamD/ComL family)
MRLPKIPFVVLALVVMGGCFSGPVKIDEGLSPAELIQKAQEASDRNRYSQADQYYRAILDRFPNDIDMICAAEYEIAFINYKRKDYDTAKKGFHALLERYTGTDGDLLPQKFRILSNTVLDTISKKESR